MYLFSNMKATERWLIVMSLKKSLIEGKAEQLFVAYSNVYIEDAILSVGNNPYAEVIVIQPYSQDISFTSAKKALDSYRKMMNTQGIPILFTPQGRRDEKGQYFEYGSILIDIIDLTDDEHREKLKVNLDSNKWVLQAQDDLYSIKNLLAVKAPIIKLAEIHPHDMLPVSVAINVLQHNYGKPVKAISIPAPKLIKGEYKDILVKLLG